LLDKDQATAHDRAFFDREKKLRGLFAEEMNNVTFAGERGAAQRMIDAFAPYVAIDGRIRSLERAGRHDEAVRLCIGTGPKDSNAVFAKFDDALHEVLAINQRELDAVLVDGDHALATAQLLNPIAAILIALLTILGIRPRLREYTA
jgi:hypothetical protein